MPGSLEPTSAKAIGVLSRRTTSKPNTFTTKTRASATSRLNPHKVFFTGFLIIDILLSYISSAVRSIYTLRNLWIAEVDEKPYFTRTACSKDRFLYV